ncbi:hypothetical protein BD626DRAFT_518845 [Schizophyllum amplum]|uniref:Uncharacterized protein n=1 Tax=Schizophyllum amplum TaxID=97359 RepID=A0A550BVL7_9AGAR|nr:hypothetical protein BD626DRAFT_518845 [Auriculariopsis ampla]
MSRTSKDFRNILLSHSARFVWQKSMALEESFPPVLKGMNEPQFVSLAFDEICDRCCATDAHTIAWREGARYCKPCLYKHFYTYEQFVAFDQSEVQRHQPLYRISYYDVVYPAFLSATTSLERRQEEVFFPRNTVHQYNVERLRIDSHEKLAKWFTEKHALYAEYHGYHSACIAWEQVHHARKEEALRREQSNG